MLLGTKLIDRKYIRTTRKHKKFPKQIHKNYNRKKMTNVELIEAYTKTMNNSIKKF